MPSSLHAQNDIDPQEINVNKSSTADNKNNNNNNNNNNKEGTKLDAKNNAKNDKKDQKKKSFIVEAETVNTESTNILPQYVTTASNSEVNSVLTPIRSGNEELPTHFISNNMSQDEQLMPTSEGYTSQETIPFLAAPTRETGTRQQDLPHVSNVLTENTTSEVGALTRPPIIVNNSSKKSSSNSLIDDNPLPIPSHININNNNNNSFLKNKKSSLLVDSQDVLNNLNPDNNSNNIKKTEDTRDGVNKEQITPMSLRSNHLETSEMINHEKSSLFQMNRGNGLENKDIKSHTDLKPYNKSIDPRPASKIMERPVMSSMNSRDLLLNENKNVNEETKHPEKNKLSHEKIEKKIMVPSVNKEGKDSHPSEKKNISPQEEYTKDNKKVALDNKTNTDLVTPEEDTNGQKSNKTDFFAARLASAVGENEISDSEETFVYESAANSTKNLIFPNSSTMGLSTNQVNDLRNVPHSSEINNDANLNKNHGITTKLSVPLLNTNKKLMNRLKNTRHTSTGGILSHSSLVGPSSPSHIPQGAKSYHLPNTTTVNAISNLNTDANPNNVMTLHETDTTPSSVGNGNQNKNIPTNKNGTTINNNNNNLYSISNTSGLMHNDDIPSMRSINNTERQNDIQSVRSFMFEQHQNRSPDKRMSAVSLNKFAPGKDSNLPSGFVQTQAMMKNSVSNLSSNVKDGNNKKNGENKRVLRTTVSKIFDSNGTPLRRYSGVPDNVNLEDYIEQTDDLNSDVGLPRSSNHHSGYFPNRGSKYNEDGEATNDIKRASTGSHISSNWNLSPGTYYIHDTSAIKEEDEDEPYTSTSQNEGSYVPKKNSVIKNNIENRNNDPGQEIHFQRGTTNVNNNNNNNDDDIHSTFYYNHRADLEARPEISDYEDGDLDADRDDGYNEDTGYYRSHPNINSPHIPYYGQNNTNSNKSNMNYGNGSYYDYGYPTEYTPLKHSARKRLSRNQLNFSPHDFTTKKSTFTKFKNGVFYFILTLVLLATGFLFGFLLATNKELQNFNIILLDNVISSAEELIFDIAVSAFNPGLFTITIDTIDIDVFAKSAPVLETEALFLGSINEMETPLTFAGGFFNRRYAASATSLKILSPGNSTISDNMKWRRLIKHDYELILRGTMKYSVPMFDSSRTINVQKSTTVSNNKGEPSSLSQAVVALTQLL